MKKLFALLAVVLAVVSCQKESNDLAVNMGEQETLITVALPEATRASSGAGFDLATLGTDFELRYILEIYVEGNTENCIRKEAFTPDTSNPVVFPVRLVPGRDYRIVAWADIVPTITGERTAEGDYDYYYETSKGLDEVRIIETGGTEWNAMDEYRDAYTAYDVVYGFSANKGLDLTLTRPFAKVRVVSTDIKDIEDLGYELKNGTVEYSVSLNRQFNALNGTANDARAKAHTLFTYPTPYDDKDNKNSRTLFADYIFVDKTWEQDAIQFTMSVYAQDGLLKTTTFNTDIALHANTLTTIIGEVLTEGGYVKVEVDGKLDEIERYNVVSSASQLLKVLNSGEEYILGNNIIVTAADLNEFKSIITRGNETKTTIINLNGYTVTIQNDGTGEPVVLESGNTLIFAGEGAIEGTGELVDNSNDNANVVVTGGATVAEGTTTEAVLTGLAALKHVCANGGEFTFAKDLTSSEILTITANNVVINGNGKTLTSTAGRAINVSGATDVTIKNLTIVASGERAINIIQNATNITIDNVTATAANYTVNVAGSAPNAVVAIKNSTLNGLCTVNVSSVGTTVTVDGSTVNCNDNNTTEGEAYAALSLNREAVGGKIIATNTTINVAEGSDSIVARNGAEDGVITIDGSDEDVAVMYAAITYPGSDYYHAFQTIKKAVEFAKSGDVITLIRNVESTEALIIDNGKTLTLDLNGKTVSGKTFGNTNPQDLFLVKGNLTVKNGTITAEHVGENMGWGGQGTIFNITAGGVVNLNSVIAKYLGGTDMGFVAHLNNWGEVTLNVENSTLESNYVAVRVFNSGYDMNNVTIKNSTLKGGSYAFWVHNYTVADFGTEEKAEAQKALLNFDIFNGTNTFIGKNETPIRYGMTNAIYTVAGSEIVSTVDELIAALAEGKNVVLSSDLTINEGITAPYGNKTALSQNGGVFNGNGKTITSTIAGDSYIYMTNGGTTKNLNVTGAFRGIMIMNANQTVYLENVVSGGKGVVYALNTGEGNSTQDLVATNCTFNGWSSFDLLKSATFTNCTFGQGSEYPNVTGRVLKPYINTTFTNCSFIAHMNLDLSELGAGHKIVMKGCTVDGQAVTAETFTIPTTNAQYETELFTIDLPSWATSVADCVICE